MSNTRPLYRVFSLIAVLVLVGAGAAPASAALISVLERISPLPVTYPQNPDASGVPDDHEAFLGSPTGDVTAALHAVDLFSGNSGCEATDFAGFVPGSIALLERGTCFFWQKVLNAQAAGAVAALVYDDVTPSTTSVTLSGVVTAIPSVFTTEAIGDELRMLLMSGPVIMHLAVIEVPDTPVPEPMTLALLGAGLAGLALMRRRKSLPSLP